MNKAITWKTKWKFTCTFNGSLWVIFIPQESPELSWGITHKSKEEEFGSAETIIQDKADKDIRLQPSLTLQIFKARLWYLTLILLWRNSNQPGA